MAKNRTQLPLDRIACGEGLLCLRFVAAVIARCSGDKSDKEESADGFWGYGDCALRLQSSLAESSVLMVLVSTGCAVFMVYVGRTSCFRASIGLFLSLLPEPGRNDWSGVRVIRCQV
jgi:hypothetical protein